MGQLPYLPTYQNDLPVFVGELRDCLFSSQEEAAAYFHLDRSRISRYETGNSTPKIGYVAGLVQLLAEQTGNKPEVQQHLLREVNKIVASRHYRKRHFQDWSALCQAAEEYRAKQRHKPARASPTAASKTEASATWQTRLEQRPDIPPDIPLIGAEIHLTHLLEKITAPQSGWVICIDGLGGIGKTSLVNALIRHPELPKLFHTFAWVSTKQQILTPGIGLEDVSDPILDIETLIDALLSQLGDPNALAHPPAQKKAILTRILKETPALIVFDNLETLPDYRTLPPTLLKLANPSKFLVTSRHSLRMQPGVYNFTLTELSQADTRRFLQHELETRGLATAITISEDQLNTIYKVVGGHPLALKLVAGQMSVLSLPEVMGNLKRAQGKSIGELYTFIYWQAWHTLDELSQYVFLTMPLAHDGTIEQLIHQTKLEQAQVSQALEQLANLSLVQVGGNLATRRYFLHPLTETFILTETLEWKRAI